MKVFAKQIHIPVHKKIAAFWLAIFISAVSVAQIQSETGLYDTRNYTAKEYGLPPQNFAVVQDSRGVLYFGNNSGILEYDGQNWDTILTPQQGPIRSLAMDKNGVIYVGGTGEIGYLAPTSSGSMRYHSLMGYLKTAADSTFNDVWSCKSTQSGKVYFQASEKIFVWDPARKKMKVINPEPANTQFHLMFYVNGTLYVRQKDVGMKRIVDSTSTLEFIQGGEMFAQTRTYFMLPFRSDRILLNMMGQGIFTMVPANYSAHIQDAKQLTKVIPFPTNIDPYINTYKVYDGIRLNEQCYSIGTLGGGDIVIDTSGKLICGINKKSGLPDESVNSQFLDSQQKLWLATNNGISKIDINSPVTRFNDRNGLEGTVQAITRHNGKLYVATLAGVYYLSGQIVSSATSIDQPQFNRIIEGECWGLYDFKNGNKSVLMVASNDGIWQVEGDDKVTLIKKGNAEVVHRSLVDSNRLYIGWANGILSTNGLSSLYWDNGKWIDEGKIREDQVTQDITTIEEEKDGTLWCGHRGAGVIKISPIFNGKKIDDVEVKIYTKQQGLPDPDESNIYVKKIGGHIYYATPRGLFKFSDGKFSPDSSLGNIFASKDIGIFRMDQSPEGSIWMVIVTEKDNRMHVGYLKDPGTPKREWVTTPFIAVSRSITEVMHHDSDGITWLGGPDGLYRYNSNVKKNYDQDYYALIRKVIIGKDSTIFSGTYSDDSGHTSVIQSDLMKPSLRFAFNSIVFHFAAPTFDDEASILYSYYLEGFENNWSDWKNENHKEYTNLSEGHYIFHVKAKNIFGHESREATYEFTILSPWYRTIWAYIGYILFFIALVYGAITVSTRSLRNIISERTAEVVKQKEVIEMKNKDITDSINYAKRIQEAILPTRERFKSILPDSFILFKPKDIVSGDFYWMAEKGDTVFVAAGDCTGHGVPGAMVSVVCSNALNRAVKEFGITETGRILDKVRDLVIETFEKSGSDKDDIKDGMDISLCSINMKTGLVQWSGANNPLWYIQGNEIKEITADKQPIGKADNPRPFTTHTLQLQNGNELYLFTDGYADQFGGPKGKKFKYKQLEEKVLEGRSLEMNTQRDNLRTSFENWQGNLEQIDDVLIIGIRIQ